MPERRTFAIAASLQLLLVLALSLSLPAPAQARVLRAEVVHVTDGDTVWVRTAPGAPALSVRLLGIDAPEVCQAHGPQSRSALEKRLLRKRVRVISRGEDDYGRKLARVEWRGQDQGAWMVSQGHAWSHRWRGRIGPYEAEEQLARRERRGLWRGSEPAEPREFRRRHGSCRG